MILVSKLFWRGTDGMCRMPLPSESGVKYTIQLAMCYKVEISNGLWYNWLDHLHSSVVHSVIPNVKKTPKSNSMPDLCSACQLWKSHKLPMSHMHTRSSKPFDIVHVDL